MGMLGGMEVEVAGEAVDGTEKSWKRLTIDELSSYSGLAIYGYPISSRGDGW
jgi:hypothetical protein